MILVETNFTDVVTESDGDKKKMYIKGIFMEAENQNRNGRVYQKQEMQREVDKINAKISNGEDVLGELDHPSTLEVKLENVSHAIRELTMDGTRVYGKAEVLNTPKGQIAQSLLNSGIKIGVSSRGSGSVNGENMVENFNLVTVDMVATPSVQSAIPETIWESLEMYKRGGEIMNLAEAIRHDPKAQKYFRDEINKFIKNLGK